MFRRIEIEADTVEQAVSQLESQLPEGYELLATDTLSAPRASTARFSAPTTESAFGKARRRVPKGAIVTLEREIEPARSEIVRISAFDEETARQELRGRLLEGTKLVSFVLEKAGGKGFLGIGRKPAVYRAQLFHPAVVELSYSGSARVLFLLMSAAAGGVARAAVAELLAIYERPASGEEEKSEAIRAVGRRLESEGGFDLMLGAHTLLSRERPAAAGIVQRSWNGIGAWMS